MWRELAQVLTLGCAVQDGDMVMPWFFAQDLGEDEDFGRSLVAGSNVPMREAGSAHAKVLRLLSWVLVRRIDPAGEAQPRFTRVRLDGATATGYIETALLRGQLDYRLGAHRGPKGWKITYFTSGD